MTQGAMPYNDFLNAIIDDGIEEAKVAYAGPGRELKREGAIAGFEACRGKARDELQAVLSEARRDARAARERRAADYWYWRLREAQVEWVLNVVNAADYANGRDTDHQPTARGLAKAADILGVAA